MNFGISFAPLVPFYVVWAGLRRARSCRIALLLRAAVAHGPRIGTGPDGRWLSPTHHSRAKTASRIASVAAVVVDKSPSQNFGDRPQQTEAARAALVERLEPHPRP